MCFRDIVSGEAVRCDVSREDDVRTMIEAIIKRHKKIDFFFSNAGRERDLAWRMTGVKFFVEHAKRRKGWLLNAEVFFIIYFFFISQESCWGEERRKAD